MMIGKFRIDDEFDRKMLIIDSVYRFFEGFCEEFLNLREDEFIRNSEDDHLLFLIQIEDTDLTQKREDLLVILVLSEMLERFFPDTTEQLYGLRRILFYDIKKHRSEIKK